MEYRRAKTPGATYFFTVVTYNRQKILCEPENIDLLRKAFRYVIQKHPFKIDGIVILPDHLHSLWTLPENDANFSTRWRLIKSYFSRKCYSQYEKKISTSRQDKKEKTVWQRRFWEHQIQGDSDFANHLEYIHYNPVHHGLVTAPKDREYSSFHRYVKAGIYNQIWGSSERLIFDSNIGRAIQDEHLYLYCIALGKILESERSRRGTEFYRPVSRKIWLNKKSCVWASLTI